MGNLTLQIKVNFGVNLLLGEILTRVNTTGTPVGCLTRTRAQRELLRHRRTLRVGESISFDQQSVVTLSTASRHKFVNVFPCPLNSFHARHTKSAECVIKVCGSQCIKLVLQAVVQWRHAGRVHTGSTVGCSGVRLGSHQTSVASPPCSKLRTCCIATNALFCTQQCESGDGTHTWLGVSYIPIPVEHKNLVRCSR